MVSKVYLAALPCIEPQEHARPEPEEARVPNRYNSGWGSPRDGYDWLQLGSNGARQPEPRAYEPPPVMQVLYWWSPVIWWANYQARKG